MIDKIKLVNFRKFRNTTINFNESINILIGDNESGKSSILSAIDIVLSGSRSKVENKGLDSLFNVDAIAEFLNSEKTYKNLPVLFVEVYLKDMNEKILEGKYNSEDTNCHGLLLICQPREDLSKEIADILNQTENNFPFEYYSVTFKTFSGESYTGYRKFLEHILLDNSAISSEYATKSHIKTLYQTFTGDTERSKFQNEYRKHKEQFKGNVLTGLNQKIADYEFSVKTSTKSNLETDLTIKQGNIDILDKGKGAQSYVKADFALQKKVRSIDVLLFEEPENHLSHTHMSNLIYKIKDATDSQMFISTHSTMISTRLDLRNSILLSPHDHSLTYFSDLDEDTAKFFMKSPGHNLLEFILSKKVILVEGHSEFILLEAFFKNITGSEIKSTDIHVIAVGGKCFNRYINLSKHLNIKTAIITDNDSNYKINIADKYQEYLSDNISVFADTNEEISTFEIAVYEANKDICEKLWAENRRTLSVQQYMLSNKANCAFELIDKKIDRLIAPEYISEAIKWISD